MRKINFGGPFGDELYDEEIFFDEGRLSDEDGLLDEGEKGWAKGKVKEKTKGKAKEKTKRKAKGKKRVPHRSASPAVSPTSSRGSPVHEEEKYSMDYWGFSKPDQMEMETNRTLFHQIPPKLRLTSQI